MAIIVPHTRRKGTTTTSTTNRNSPLLSLSLCLNVLLLFLLCVTLPSCRKRYQSRSIVFHGGHPDTDGGQCYCNKRDTYCLCSPSLAIDLVIVSGDNNDSVWLVRRKDTNQLATMGGFVQIGETVKEAVRRELQEEMGVSLDQQPLSLFGVYSDPRRDKRRHTVSVAFVLYLDGTKVPHPHDDVKEVVRVSLNNLNDYDFFADHKTILNDYKTLTENGRKQAALSERDFLSSTGDFASNIHRSVCRPLFFL